MTPDEIAAVKAEHAPNPSRRRNGERHGWWCDVCDEWSSDAEGGCLPYLLAVEVERLAGKVVRVETLATPRRLVACVTECGFCGSVETCDALNPLRTFVYTDDLRAALANQP